MLVILCFLFLSFLVVDVVCFLFFFHPSLSLVFVRRPPCLNVLVKFDVVRVCFFLTGSGGCSLSLFCC